MDEKVKIFKTPIKLVFKNGIKVSTYYEAQTKTLPSKLFLFETDWKLDLDSGEYKEI